MLLTLLMSQCGSEDIGLENLLRWYEGIRCKESLRKSFAQKYFGNIDESTRSEENGERVKKMGLWAHTGGKTIPCAAK